jgi:hypothetical protein
MMTYSMKVIIASALFVGIGCERHVPNCLLRCKDEHMMKVNF